MFEDIDRLVSSFAFDSDGTVITADLEASNTQARLQYILLISSCLFFFLVLLLFICISPCLILPFLAFNMILFLFFRHVSCDRLSTWWELSSSSVSESSRAWGGHPETSTNAVITSYETRVCMTGSAFLFFRVVCFDFISMCCSISLSSEHVSPASIMNRMRSSLKGWCMW